MSKASIRAAIQRKSNRIKLQKLWYIKLKAEGFNELEKFDAQMEPTGDLKHAGRTNLLFEESPQTTPSAAHHYESTLAYYEAARELLRADTGSSGGIFKDGRDRLIWERHTDGQTSREMSVDLDVSYKTCQRRIKYYDKIMKHG